MQRKNLQQTYETNEAALQQALAELDAAKDDSPDNALADLPEPDEDEEP